MSGTQTQVALVMKFGGGESEVAGKQQQLDAALAAGWQLIAVDDGIAYLTQSSATAPPPPAE